MTTEDRPPTTDDRRYHDSAIEALSAEELRRLQWERFRALLERVAERNAFYRERFAAAGVKVDRIRDRQDLPLLPITRKEDVVADIARQPPYGTRLEVPPERIDKVVESSGTTGLGREVQALTAADTRAFHQLAAFGLRWAGVEPGSVVMSTVPITTTGAGQVYYGALRELGANVFQIGTYDAVRKLDYLRRFPTYLLIATPSYIRRLELVARQEGIEPRALGVRALAVAGEPYSVAFGLAREEVWGARLYEQYGATQRVAAWTCERGALADGGRGVLHNLSHLTLCEVIDPGTGKPVDPGETGELIITPLQAEATPLIRFATGDRVRLLPPEACPCGRPFEGFEAGTVQRFDSMIKVRGVNLWPETVDAVVLSHPQVRDYRGEVRLDDQARERLVLTVETLDRVESNLGPTLAEELRRTVGLRFEVTVGGPGTLPESNDVFAKSRRWQDRRLKT